MFERFTDRARRALVAAQADARHLGAGDVDLEHILLGLLAIGDGVAYDVLSEAGLTYERARRLVAGAGAADAAPLDADALSSLGIDLDAVREAVDASFGSGAFDKVVGRDEPQYASLLSRRSRGVRFGERSKTLLASALREAIVLRHHYIGTEHILLALLGETHGNVGRIVASVGDPSELRSIVINRVKRAS